MSRDDESTAEGGHDYRHVDVDALPDAPNPTSHKKEVDEAVGASAFGFNVYEAAPGERVPWGYHFHPDHEELFYVVAGTLHVETPDGEFAVGEGEAFFVPAGAPNRAVAGDERVRFVAVGAPKDRDRAVIREPCPACEEETDRTYEAVETDEGKDGETTYVLRCASCGAETDRFSSGPT